MAEDLECSRKITFDIFRSDEEDHDSVGGVIRSWGGGTTDYALEICSLEIPAGAVSRPHLLHKLTMLQCYTS